MGAWNLFLRFVHVTCAGVVIVVLLVSTDRAACFPDLINMALPRQALTTYTNSCFYCSSTHIGSTCFYVSVVVCAIAIHLEGKHSPLNGKTSYMYVIYNCLDRHLRSGCCTLKKFYGEFWECYGNADWVMQENRDQSCFCVGCQSAIVIKLCNWL